MYRFNWSEWLWKTTLIKSVLGMVLPDSGMIHFNGNSVLGEYLYRTKNWHATN